MYEKARLIIFIFIKLRLYRWLAQAKPCKHSARPATHYSYSLSSALHLARPVPSCCPVKVAGEPRGSRPWRRGRPVARAAQGCWLGLPTPLQPVPIFWLLTHDLKCFCDQNHPGGCSYIQRLSSYDLTALYKSVHYYYYKHTYTQSALYRHICRSITNAAYHNAFVVV